jgi:predicted small secreted protein
LFGPSDATLAEQIDVDERTIDGWKLSYPEFCQFIKKGKDVAAVQVAASLFKSATGGHFVKRGMVISFAKLVALLVLFSTGLSSCAEFKEAGRTIGHTTRDVTREIGHGTRDAAKEIGHGTKRVVNSIGQEINDDEQ